MVSMRHFSSIGNVSAGQEIELSQIGLAGGGLISRAVKFPAFYQINTMLIY